MSPDLPVIIILFLFADCWFPRYFILKTCNFSEVLHLLSEFLLHDSLPKWQKLFLHLRILEYGAFVLHLLFMVVINWIRSYRVTMHLGSKKILQSV